MNRKVLVSLFVVMLFATATFAAKPVVGPVPPPSIIKETDMNGWYTTPLPQSTLVVAHDGKTIPLSAIYDSNDPVKRAAWLSGEPYKDARNTFNVSTPGYNPGPSSHCGDAWLATNGFTYIRNGDWVVPIHGTIPVPRWERFVGVVLSPLKWAEKLP